MTYGTFAPDAQGYQFPRLAQIAEDFRLMAELGINTVRIYTPPRPRPARRGGARSGLRVMVGLPWSQHVAFLDDRSLRREIRRELVGEGRRARRSSGGADVRARQRDSARRRPLARPASASSASSASLYEDAKEAAPDSLFTYVNFPPTEFLDLSFFDICAFNVYLHREPELRAYLARLQHIAGHKPLLLAEAGADSIREGEDGPGRRSRRCTSAPRSKKAPAARSRSRGPTNGGAAAITVDDWAFGLVDRERRPKPAARAVAAAFADAPFSRERQRTWPRVSVVVCAYNAADTLEDCLRSLEQLTYPDYEIILVNDGSTDRTSEIGRAHRAASASSTRRTAA